MFVIPLEKMKYQFLLYWRDGYDALVIIFVNFIKVIINKYINTGKYEKIY